MCGMPFPADPAELRRVESARYALLRRLALAMRHHMVVHLQPMAMISEMLQRRLQAGDPAAEQVRDALGRIHELSRSAVESCLDMVTWLAPAPESRIALDAGVLECLGLLRGNFAFRGFPFMEEMGDVPQQVSRAAVRNVLPAVLLSLTDRAPPPADVCVRTAVGTDGSPTVTVEVRPNAGDPGFPGNHPYRLLDWGEVQALASAEDVAVSREGAAAKLVFPLA
jgi:hypothetical protein